MGVVQGRGGLVLGSLIPCALFYFLQLYIKRNRPPLSPGSPIAASPATPSGAAAGAVSRIHPTLSRGIISPRGSRPLRRSALARAGDEDSLYYSSLHCCADDPYHPASNPFGIIQLGLTKNHLSLDLVRRWMEEHAGPALPTPGGDDEDMDLTIRGLATYQPYDGILALKMVEAFSRCSGLPREKATLKSIDYQVRMRKSFMELLMDDTSGKTALRCVAPIPKGQLYSQITGSNNIRFRVGIQESGPSAQMVIRNKEKVHCQRERPGLVRSGFAMHPTRTTLKDIYLATSSPCLQKTMQIRHVVFCLS